MSGCINRLLLLGRELIWCGRCSIGDGYRSRGGGGGDENGHVLAWAGRKLEREVR